VDLDLIDEVECGQKADFKGLVDDSQLCAGIAGQAENSCYGDSGGPLVYYANGNWYQVGIVSWDINCGNFGVYSDVSYFAPWINETINGLSVSGHSLPSLYTDFGVVGVGETSSRVITLKNNSSSIITLSTLALAQGSSSVFSLSEQCPASLNIGESCEFTVTLHSGTAGSYRANVSIASSANTIAFTLTGDTVATTSALSSAFADSSRQWYTGGDLPWTLDRNKAVDFLFTLKAGAVSDGNVSILSTYFNGSGTLSYSGETNITADEALFVFLDNVWIDFRTGTGKSVENNTFEHSKSYTDGNHQLTFVYMSTAESSQASLRNVWLTRFSVSSSAAETTTVRAAAQAAAINAAAQTTTAETTITPAAIRATARTTTTAAAVANAVAAAQTASTFPSQQSNSFDTNLDAVHRLYALVKNSDLVVRGDNVNGVSLIDENGTSRIVDSKNLTDSAKIEATALFREIKQQIWDESMYMLFDGMPRTTEDAVRVLITPSDHLVLGTFSFNNIHNRAALATGNNIVPATKWHYDDALMNSVTALDPARVSPDQETTPQKTTPPQEQTIVRRWKSSDDPIGYMHTR